MKIQTHKEEVEAFRRTHEKRLKEMLDNGNHTVYCFVTRVASSGMSRHMSFFVVADNQPYSINGYLDVFGLFKLNNDDNSVKVSGCGMDMGFHVVHALSVYLYGDEHENAYKLKHRWF